MSDTTSSLTQLASFIGESATPRGEKVNGLADNLAYKPQRRGVGDLLGVVLTLSARTRRMILPPVGIDLDVFSPDGVRAVRVLMGPQR